MNMATNTVMVILLTLSAGGNACADSFLEEVQALMRDRKCSEVLQTLVRNDPGITAEDVDRMIQEKTRNLHGPGPGSSVLSRTVTTSVLGLPLLTVMGAVMHQLGEIGTARSSTFMQAMGSSIRGLVNPRIALPLLALTAGFWAVQHSVANSLRRAAQQDELRNLTMARDKLHRQRAAMPEGSINDGDLSLRE